MSSLYAYIVVFFMLLGGHDHTDLLDAVAPDVYWQIKGVTPSLAQLEKDADADAPPANFDDVVKRLQSDDFPTRDKARQELERMGPAVLEQLKPLVKSPDAEVAAVAADLVKRYSEHGQERAIRRLMAIRTLGERKEKAALPLLKGLEESKELFVADYARRAEAQIRGEKADFSDSAAELERDLALLPGDTALVLQTRGISPAQLTVAGVVDRTIAATVAVPDVPPPELPDRRQLILESSKSVLSLAERVGDLRVDGMTMGLTVNKDDDGWAAIILHGKYDAGLVFDAVRERMSPVVKVSSKPGDIPAMAMEDGELVMLCPDNAHLVLLVSTKEKDTAFRDAFVAGLKAGKGGFDDNKEMAALLKTVDTRSPAWMAANLTETMRTGAFNGCKTVTLDSRATKDGATFTLKATGDDEAAVKAAAEGMGASISGELPLVQAQAQQNPNLKPAADFMESLKISLEGKNVTVSGEMSARMLDAMVRELSPLAGMISLPGGGPPADPVPEDAVK